jgi:5'-3' exoribonuclease 1
MNDDEDDEEDEEAHIAMLRIIKRYDNMKVAEIDPEQVQQDLEKKYEERFQQWKDKYYQDKFGWGLDNEKEMKDLTETYVQGLQWVLYYYYQGVASWPWFYKFHYSPMISGA